MSGGHWNHMDRTLSYEIFDYYADMSYGLSGDRHDQELKRAIKMNPLNDAEISGLLYDVFCLLHSYDWAISGDTDMDEYQKDVAAFKERWFDKARSEQIQETIDICLENLKDELYRTFLPSKSDKQSN